MVTGVWETHPASPPPTVYRLRSSGRRCCWVSGHRRATWACWTWTPASWTFHSENTNVRNKPPRGILPGKVRGQRLTRLVSLDLVDGVLLDEATDDGLRGASFFTARRLSRPFSRGEWAGLPLGEAGSCRRRAQTRCEQTREPRGRRCECSASYLVGDVDHQIVVALLAVALLRQRQQNKRWLDLRWRLNVAAVNMAGTYVARRC